MAFCSSLERRPHASRSRGVGVSPCWINSMYFIAFLLWWCVVAYRTNGRRGYGHPCAPRTAGAARASAKPGAMLSALMMTRRLAAALRVALRDEDFGRILSAAILLIVIGTITLALGNDWSIVDGFYVAVATLTTSSILDPKLTVTDPWLKVFLAGYVLVGIGILVEDRKSTRLNSSHLGISYAVFCLKKKKNTT